MNRVYKIWGSIALLLLLFVSSANAQNKIGYTDPDLIIASMSEYNQVMQQVQAFYQTKQQELQQEALDLERAVGEYQNQAGLMTAEAKTAKETELAGRQQAIQQKAAQAEQEFNAKQAELLEPLLAKVQKAIDEVAVAQSLAMVVRAPMLLYANDTQTVDITREVAAKLGIPLSAQ